MTEVAFKTWNDPRKASNCMELRSKENNDSRKKTAIKKLN